MSNKVLNAVWDHSASKASARLVLLVIADEAADNGLLTAHRRSQTHLARKANISRATVPRALAELVALGELEVLTVGDGRVSSDYRVVLPGLDQDEHPGGSGRAPRPLRTSTQGAQPEPPIIPLVSPSSPYDPPAGADAPVALFDDKDQVNGKGKEPKNGRATANADALTIARAVWDRRKEAGQPTPATPWLGAVTVFAKLLEAGHAPATITEAALAAPTLTVAAVEVQISRRAEARLGQESWRRGPHVASTDPTRPPPEDY